ncbi:ferritin-like domain-containing protein [Caldimonas brevitalea]|uniref:Uncharacterized protein n=1 Tax=Caldimonas brevitalea TaxID=413882 RepID=A0A0G3BQA7_9BURK|nr:ferritin-like domain-containing protein [Caldimonas brevitalea]AKJ29541.1 hypothetical protein AAW51_2850 [Caldimonas brevitalea]
MQEQTPLGRNRTGVQMSPIDSERMQAGTEALDPVPSELGYATVRQAYMNDDQGLGSVPVPGTMKGMLKSGMDMMTGKRPQTFVDKLGERLAFERGGVRLYDGLLVKCTAAPHQLPDGALELLTQFRQQEAEHFALVAEALETLGADPTAQTPCADLVGVESLGLVQAMNDPRTSVLQALHVMLDAELLDNAAWELLIRLAEAAGHDEIASRFELAMRQEANHLAHLRGWVEQLTLDDASVVRAAGRH